MAVVADLADGLPSVDVLTGDDGDSLGPHVPVHGGQHVAAQGVVDDDPLPEASGGTGGGDGAVGGCVDGGSFGCGEVLSAVLLGCPGDGIGSRAEG